MEDFILEILTILLLILAIVGLIISYRQHNKSKKVGELEIKDLSEEFNEQVRLLRDFNLSEKNKNNALKLKKSGKTKC